MNVIIGAIAQHDLRVAPVAQWLQRQPVCVLEPVDRTLDASKQRRLVRDCPCPQASSLRADSDATASGLWASTGYLIQ